VNTGDLIYALLRVSLSVVGALGWAYVVRLAIPVARKANTPERRLRMVTVVFMLAELSILLALTALYDWARPPSSDAFLAVVGMAIRASVAIGAIVIIWTWPHGEDGLSKGEHK
jgi:hypothetical protein